MSTSRDAEMSEATTAASQEGSNSGSSKSLSELRAEGRAAEQSRDLDAAETAYRTLLAIDPTDIYASVGLGMVSRLRGERDEALQRFRQAAAIWPSHPWPLLEISAELSAANLLDEAEATLRRALQFSPRHYHVLMGLGGVLRSRDNHEQASEMFRSAAGTEPTQASAYVELAVELAHLGREDEALATLDAGVNAGAAKFEILAAKARMLRAIGQNEAALTCWGMALADKPDESTLKLEIAAETIALGRHADALVAYRAVIDDEQIATSQRRDAALAAGRIATDQKNRRLAIEFLEQAAALDANHLETRRDLADLYRADQRFRDAEAIYCLILNQKADDLAMMGGLAIVRRQLGNHDEALELLQAASAVDPKNEWIRYEFAISLRDVGRTDEAIAILESIAPPSSVYCWSRMSLGHMARARGARQNALEYFEQAAAMAADPTDALCQIAGEQRALRAFSEAESTIARIFAHASESFHGHMADGYLKRATNDFAGARAAFLRAAVIMPTNPQPQVEIAAEERKRGDWEAAATAIEIALRLDPRHEEALLKKAAYLAEMGDADAALLLYKKLRDERPNSIWGYLEAAQLLSDQGDFGAAMALMAVARKACARDSEIDLREAGILRRHGFLNENFELLTLAHARYPQELRPWFSRTAAAIDLGFFDLAEALLSGPPPAASQERSRIIKLHTQLNKARWNLDAAIDNLGSAISLDANDLDAVYERAKLKLITFDLAGAHVDLLAHTELRRPAARLEGRSANRSQSLIGQLYEEFALTCEPACDPTALRGLSAPEQVPKFAELVQLFPDSTAPAIGLMIALRRAGRFNRPPTRPTTSPPSIPQRITQFWNDPEPPPDVRLLMESWALSDPRFKIEVFDDTKAFSYLQERSDPAVARAFRRANEPTQRADLFRLARLFLEGGYYIDADDRARGGLEAHVPHGVEFFAHQEELGSIGNNILGVVPAHPVIDLALREAVAAVMRGDRDVVWLSTGPGLLTRALASWFSAVPSATDERIARVAILTLAEIRRTAAMGCHAAYKTTSRAWLNAAFPKRNRP